MWIRSTFFLDREVVDGFLREREYECVRLAETIEHARAYPSRAQDFLGLLHYGSPGIIDGAIAVDREGSVHCVLPKDGREDVSLRDLLNPRLRLKKVTGPAGDTLRLMCGLRMACRSTQMYTLMRLCRRLIAPFAVSEMGGVTKQHLPVEVRDATGEDSEDLIALHGDYEREELLMNSSRAETEYRIRMLQAHQMISVAYLGSSLIGKINTNARGIFCDQIGGFYVKPEYRSMSVGAALMNHLLLRIMTAEKDAVLYVRRGNVPALRIYDNAGFLPVGEYAMSTVSLTH